MSLQFPSNPTNGQTYQPSGQPQIYTYSGGKWAVQYNAQTASNAAFAASASQAENANFAVTASYAATVGNADIATSASYSQTASYVAILGDGITVNYSEFGIELTGSGGGGSQNLDGVLSVGRNTSGSITMGEYPYWPTNWLSTASLAIGSGSVSLTSHSLALGLRSIVGNPNSIAIGNGSITGRYLYDDNSITVVDQTRVQWTGLGLPTPPADWFKVGKSYILFGDNIFAIGDPSLEKALIINNVTSVTTDFLGRLTVNHSGITGQQMTINSSFPRIWIEVDSAPYSFAQGEGVFSAGGSQHVIGQYNSELSDVGAFIVGNGSDNANRSNLFVASGDTVQITGSLWVNGTEITGGGSVSASYAQTASYVTILGDGITVNYSEFGIELTGSVPTTPTLQEVSDAGSSTTTAITISAILNQGSSNVAEGAYSHVEGWQNTAVGNYSHAEGIVTTAIGANSHAEGAGTTSVGGYSHAEGEYSRSTGVYSHAEGNNTNSDGNYSHAEGQNTTSGGANSHAEGFGTIASGLWSHAEGYQTVASFIASHAEGYLSVASADPSHAEGISTLASGIYSHAEGNTTVAAGRDSHAEGQNTTTIGGASHAEGYNTSAVGGASHAEGLGTIALGTYSHAQGQYNIPIDDQSAFIIGNGSDDANRSNLLVASGDILQVTGSLQITDDILSNGNIEINKGNPRLKLRDSSGGGHSQGFDIHVDNSSFIIDDNTHNIDILSFTYDGTYHSASFNADLFEFNGQVIATGITGSLSGSVSNIGDEFATPHCNTIVTLTALEYSALSPKDPNTLYFIV